MSAQSHSFEDWDEIRIAYQVARLGTLSAAAEHLGVHHATVIRHIDTLEQRLGCKLFHRHARGYAPTEAGKDLMKVAAVSEDQFNQLASRLNGQNDTVSGELIVTTTTGLTSMISPCLLEFQRKYPAIRIKLMAEDRLFRLDYGEAHVALRAGPKPEEPDNIVQLLAKFSIGLYAHKSYVAKFGLPKNADDLAKHSFIANGGKAARAPFNLWLKNKIDESQIVFSATYEANLNEAISAGIGAGFLTEFIGANDQDLVQFLPSNPDWDVIIWLVTHVDLHRSAKVQAFTKFLKARFAEKQAMCKINEVHQ